MTQKDFPAAWKLLKRQTRQFNIPWIDSDSKARRDPFRVLVSCIISLRTQDRVTETSSRRLFEVAGTPQDMIKLTADRISELIYPAGFYKTKAERILEICRELVDRHNSLVPDSIEDLLKFKGVGRKTANLVITAGFNKPGICVDTHVHRIPNRWGLIDTANPKATEEVLRSLIPIKIWKDLNRYLVAFGQNLCKPLSPLCSRCAILQYCDKKGVKRFR